MKHQAISMRPFIGAKDFSVSRRFYADIGFEETILSPAMSVFKIDKLAFYLQDFYIEDWINNSMIFLEVDNAQRYYNELLALDLPSRYENVRLVPTRTYDWGSECFLHDPSGVLWHFGEFVKV